MTAPCLFVMAPGFSTTVQDLGRFGHRHQGVPVGGALDPDALLMANALVGNPPGAAALEILYVGPTLRVDAEATRLAIVGDGSRLLLPDGTSAEPGCSVTLPRGAEVVVQASRSVSCAIVAVAGGFALPPFLGSLSTYARAGLGGYAGRALEAGDVLPLAQDSVTGTDLIAPQPSQEQSGPVRVVLGPQSDAFDDEVVNAFLGGDYTVGQESDRMGLRLMGPPLRHRGAADIISEPLLAGSIQVPGSGQPILMLADHGTVGGYPKIATVIRADRSRIGRMMPGKALRFAAISVEEATELLATSRKDRERMLAGTRPRVMNALEMTDRLLRENLISGVFGAEPSAVA